MCDCITHFIHALSKTYTKSDMKLILILLKSKFEKSRYISKWECQSNSSRACFWENKSFRYNLRICFVLISRKILHYKPSVFAKSVVSYYLR